MYCWELIPVAVLCMFVGVAARQQLSSCIVVLTDDNQHMKIEQYGENAIRVRIVQGDSPFLNPPDVISAFDPKVDALRSLQENVTCSKVVMNHQPQTLISGNLRVDVTRPQQTLKFTRISDGKVLLEEANCRTLTPTITNPPLPGFYSTNVAFKAVDGERIYGLGQHKTGILDHKEYGKAFTLAPANTEILIPVAHSSLGYAFLFNHPGFGTVQFNASGSYWSADVLKQIDIWVATTTDSPPHTVSPWAQLQGAYVNATGHSPVYPEWTSGFWQCKNRYHNQTQIMDVVHGYTSRDYPISLIIIDYYSWAPDPLGDESLPAACWPNPKQMVADLHEEGVELMISPYFHSIMSTSKHFAEANASGYIALGVDGKPLPFYDNAFVYDLFQPEARAFAFQAVDDGYIKPYGLHHWWIDCDEPCGGNTAGVVYNRGAWPAAYVGAAYPHMIDKMVWEGMGAPGKEYVNDNVMLARSAWAGTQRYGGAVWSGDTHSDFTNLQQQFRAGLNMVMSGIAYWTTDIGGYSGGNIDDPMFRELIVRWFQWGAFCPLFRLHGHRSGGPNEEGGTSCGSSSSSNEIWNFGNESEAAIVRVMRLREQLRPYVMQQYERVAADGTPVMRPLFFDFWLDPEAQRVDDQLMFGPDYLVAPQLDQGATTRTVYLPQLPSGNHWQNVFTDVVTDTTRGGVNISERTPLSGDGFGAFPLYKITKGIPYPTPPPLECNANKCLFMNNTDMATGDRVAFYNSSSLEDCCSKCQASPTCESIVWGPFDYTSGPDTCFFLGKVTAIKPVPATNNRTFACLRAS